MCVEGLDGFLSIFIFYLFDFLDKRVKSNLYQKVCEKIVTFTRFIKSKVNQLESVSMKLILKFLNEEQNNSILLDIFILKEILNNGTETTDTINGS